MEGKRSLLSFTMLWIFALTLLVNFGNARPNNQQDRAVDPEEDMPTPDIIQFWGYPAETHEVITADGYILTMHRIPYGKAKSNQIRPVVLFMHGLEESSSCWVINLVNQSAGFLFADAGFDVWMGNVRGNTYSNDHVKLNPKKREFWRFSWDEMVKYDVDATFKYIEKATGQKSIYYVGHSQGTLILFAKLSEEPAFSERVKRFFALAPVANVKNIKGLLKFLADVIYPYFPEIFDILGDGEFLPNNWFIKLASKYVCNNLIGELICDNIIFLIDGPQIDKLNATRTPVYISHAPAGTSTENILHWTQMIISGKMQKFDFRNPKKNIEHYGQAKPPLYDLKRITGTKIHLYSSKADYLADANDVEHFLVPNLNPDVLEEHVVFDSYSHLDFVWSTDIAKDVYVPIIKKIKSL